MLVQLALRNEAFLHTLSERHEHFSALQVSAIQYGIDRGREAVLMCLVLTTVEEVVDGITVSQYNGVIAPLIAQDVNQQTIARATGLTLETLVGTHHLAYVTFLHQGLESRQISLPQVTVRGLHIHRMAQGLRTTVYGIVLGTGMRLVIGLPIQRDRFLHTQDGLYTQHGIQIGILTTGLLTASPTWITEDVDIRTPEGQFRITRIVRHTLRYVEQLRIIMVGTVPVGTSLIADLREDVEHQLLAEGCCQTNGLWIDGIATLTHTMTGLAPPVVRWDTETVDGDTLVHHQTHLLFRCQHAQQVFYTFSTWQLWILPRILVLSPHINGAHGNSRHCQQQKFIHSL